MTTTTWALRHDCGWWLALDPEEPGGIGWRASATEAILARDPLLFAARCRQALDAAIRGRCQLVEVQT